MRSLADFAAAVKERRPSSVSGAENRNTMEALIASSRSARQGPGSRIVLDDDFLV